MVNLVGKVRVSPLRPRCVLASGVATVFSAPARIMMKKEYLVDSILATTTTQNYVDGQQNDKNPYCLEIEVQLQPLML